MYRKLRLVGQLVRNGCEFISNGGNCEAFRPHLRDEFAQPLAEVCSRGRGCFWIATFCDGGPVATLEFKPAFAAQGAVGLGDCAEVHAEIEGQRTDGRKDVAGAKLTIYEEQPQSVDDLPVCRDGGGGVEAEGDRGAHCWMYTNNKQMTQGNFCRPFQGGQAAFEGSRCPGNGWLQIGYDMA